MPSPKLVPLLLTDGEREALEALARKRTASQALALQARIVLACAENGGVAQADRGVAGVGPQVADPVRRGRDEGPDGREAARGAAEDHRRAGRGRGHPGPDREGPRAGHALVDPGDGGRDGPVAVVGLPDLARLRPQAPPGRDVEAVRGPASATSSAST
jgi:hypothetical protein